MRARFNRAGEPVHIDDDIRASRAARARKRMARHAMAVAMASAR
jgi:hypothetical protein